MKAYDFLDGAPPIGRLVVIEGTERVLAELALEALLDRLLPPEVRELNLTRFDAEEIGDAIRVREAAQAMPFLAERRVVVVAETQTLRAEARRKLWDVMQEVPEGNTLVALDLLSPASKAPKGFGAQAGRDALRIDTTAGRDARARFIRETLDRLGVTADPWVGEHLVRSDADLTSVRNDLEKLALGRTRIKRADLEREALTIEDPKAYKYAGALTEGNAAEALEIAREMFANDPRAAMPLLMALATEWGYVFELARPEGRLPERLGFRERTLRPLARRVGAARAHAAYERTIRAIEAIVTGEVGSSSEEQRAHVDRVSIELADVARR